MSNKKWPTNLSISDSNPMLSEQNRSILRQSIEPFNTDGQVVAYWKFSKEYVKSGTIETGDLVLQDASGNGNDLVMQTFGDSRSVETENILKWSNSTYGNASNGQSLEFVNDKHAPVGCYFSTSDNAMINKEKFKEGFTIEAIVKLPPNFEPNKHSWMGILTRQGQASAINKLAGEKEILSTLSISNLREVQWTSHPTNLNVNETNWSFSLESKEEWYYISVVNDGNQTKLYVNGITDFRNTEAQVVGIDAVEGFGWNVGASMWSNEIDTLFSGKIQEIRITNRAIKREGWLMKSSQEGYTANGTNEQLALITASKNYNFLFLPDPQKTVRYQPEIFFTQMEWIADQKDSHNIAMTAFLGDMVDQSHAPEEWIVSDLGVEILDKQNIPYLVIAGNHDYGIGDPYLIYYGPDRYSEKEYYKGSSPSGFSSYGIIEAGSYHYLFLMVDMQHMMEDITWAKQIVKNHPNLPTILVSHEILAIAGDGISPQDTDRGNMLWNELVNEYDQIFMTVSGHNHGSVHRIMKNANGNKVIQMLVDYQSSFAGGNGWMRFAEFDEEMNKINFRSYSPWVENLPEEERTYFDVKHLTSPNDQFEIEINFKERFSFYIQSLS
ncbi:LamG-like jellyroll fold domain-containing protein [Metabacillus rhizolycopersici]|uniref:Metallophosphoesterase n=1 Tax=Metabacillus rhizolycopersici TaxID=2875709 RepID=A0ABS7UL59_9BACI|nr:LamG-like jellyroll fold domain-containing protein [Metabacillus rhizolycopersici]MBZ5748787.1 metallophosphoesterase [Metabacillus rhizolycopersici]